MMNKDRFRSVCLALIIINSNLMTQDSLPDFLQAIHVCMVLAFFMALWFSEKINIKIRRKV